MKKLIIRFLAIFLLILGTANVFSQNPKTYSVKSPDTKLNFEVGISENRLFYKVSKNGKLVLASSFLGLKLKDSEIHKNIEIKEVKYAEANETWQPIWGEETRIRNQYHQMVVYLQEKSDLKRKFTLNIKVFNDGFGFRYEFPEQKNMKDVVITDELTEFNFPEDHQAWSIPYKTEFYEGLFKKEPLSKKDTISTPVTIETKSGQFLALHEANLTDYAAMNVFPDKKSSNLKVYLTPWSTGEKVFTKTPFQTPWRMLVIADNAGDLLLSRLMLNLNDPNTIKDTSWIKPGRYIGIWWGMHMKKYTWEPSPNHGAKTENVLRYIDFAASHKFAGVLVEGWNKGWEDWKSFEFDKPYPDFDIKKITDYAKQKNVELIGHHETGGNTLKYESQLEDAFKLYNKYGVTTVKTGYVGGLLDGKEQHSGQYGVRHYRKVFETAAKYKIMIDNHEPVMPSGLQRTFPNLMTQEGVRGQEWDAWSKDGGNPAEHTTIIPFTRGLAGPIDFTPGTFNFTNTALPNTKVHTTLAKQLALSVIMYSPLQMASDMIENYENNPAFEFITSCPVNWSKTVVPNAKIGEYVTIARKDKDSENWYLGSITNADSRKLNVTLNFLDKNVKYKAKIFKDGKNADFEKNPYPVEILEMEVDSETVLPVSLARSGGTSVILVKLMNNY